MVPVVSDPVQAFLTGGAQYDNKGARVAPPSDEDAKTAVKFDAGKAGVHLLPVDALLGITSVLDFGAKKYAARNWEKGMEWDRVYGALLRHLFSWWSREDKDPETGKSHLWHAGCCILFLIAFEIRGIGKDNRP